MGPFFKRIYLDYASTTPTDKRVFKAMKPYLLGSFANPASLYKEGVETKKVLENSKKTIGSLLHAHSDELFFTGSGTEANNLVLLGIFTFFLGKIHQAPHIITSEIEHSSVLEVCKEIERRGGEVTYLPVLENGLVDPKEVRKALKPNTVLVSIQYANNEIGTIQPIREIAKEVRHFRKAKIDNSERNFPYFHTDAAQAANYLDLNVEQLGVDGMTLDGSKIYATKGVGAVYIKRGTKITPLIFGGGQEKGLRSGTENVAGIVGFTKALEIASATREKESKRLLELRDWTIAEILALYPEATLNGDQKARLPNNINICFPGKDAEFLVLRLDAKGIACSSVTSCKNLSEDSSSYVLEALGRKDCSKSSLRITMGRQTSKSDVKYLLKVLKMIK